MDLLPDSLKQTSPGPRSIAVLGTCIAEGFSDLSSADCKLDYFLMRSGVEDDIPKIAWDAYDAIVVHLTLRRILWGVFDDDHVLFHTQDLPDYAGALDTATENIRRTIERVNGSVKGAKPVFYLSFMEPPSTYQGILLNNRRQSLYHCVRTLNDRLAEMLEGDPRSHYLEMNDLVRYHGDARISDAYFTFFMHGGLRDTPEAKALFPEILRRVGDALTILKGERQVKLIITDLDDTLWKGVVAECDEIIATDHVEGWPLGYAEALIEFKRRGGLLAICSKNEHAPTLARFKSIWTNRLSLEDFCALKINWEPKSKNVGEILAETNILPANVLFVDDNPREIEEVKRAYPEMRFLTGEQQTWRNVILFSPETQVAAITAESATRTGMLNAKQKRNAASREMSREDYLRSLAIQVRFDLISDPAHKKFDRAIELLNKTNQFNTTGKRWTHAEILGLFSAGGTLLALTAADTFGDNGLVGVAMLQGSEIIQVVLSCRVFGLGLETALLCRALSSLPVRREGGMVSALLADSGKNKTCAAFYGEHGFRESGPDTGVWLLERSPEWPAWVRGGETEVQ